MWGAGGEFASGVYAYQNWKERKRQEAEERILGFHKALKSYLKASKRGKLNTKVVDNLLKALDEFEVKVKKPKAGTEGKIVSLKSYLEIQKQILESAA